MRTSIYIILLAMVGCNNQPTEIRFIPSKVEIITFEGEDLENLHRLESQEGQRMEDIKPVFGSNAYSRSNIDYDVIWDNGQRLTDDEFKLGNRLKCVHGMPWTWRCDLCPNHQRVYSKCDNGLEN